MKNFKIVAIAVTALFLETGLTAFAQTSNVQYGPVLKDQGKTHTAEILGSDKNGYYTLRSDLTTFKAITNGTENIALERYNTKNELLFSKPLPLQPVGAKKPNKFEQILLIQGQPYLFSSKLNEAKGRFSVFATKLNANGDPDGKPVEVAESEPKSKKERAFFKIAASPDNSKILILEQQKTPSNNSTKYQINVLDSNLKKVYSKTITRTLPAENTALNGFEIDNMGHAYVYFTSYRTSPNAEIKDPVNRFLVYLPEEDKINEFDVAIPGKTVTDITYAFDKDQKLVVAGLYANNHPLDRSGSFFMRINPAERQIQNLNTNAFAADLLNEFKGRSRKKDEKEGIAHMKLNKLMLREDGSAVLAAEQAYWHQVHFYDGAGRSRGSVYHYESNDILVMNITKEGKTDWITRIPKLQHTLDDDGDYNGFSIGSDQNKVFVVYNDHAKNAGQTDQAQLKPMKDASDAIQVLVTIDKDGKYQKSVLPVSNDKKIPLQPRYFMSNNDSLIIYSKEKGNYRFGKIAYN